MDILLSLIATSIQTCIAFFVGTVLFDLLHYSLHRWMRSKYKSLRFIGRLHRYHHYFFTAQLQNNMAFSTQNIIHRLAEYLIQVLGSLLCLLFLNVFPVFVAIILETYFFIMTWRARGLDDSHIPLSKVFAYQTGVRVPPEYHALHHYHPQNYFASEVRVIDYLLGTGCQLSKKRVALTGASGALGCCLKKLLEQEGAVVTPLKYGLDYDYSNYDNLTNHLKNSDILILSHGSKYDNAQQANCDSFVTIIELFKTLKKDALIPAEVWAVGSEIELEPCFGDAKLLVYAQSKRNYAQNARRYFHDKSIQYRHIVPGSFSSAMGPGLMSANFTAKITIFLIKRGFKYIPINIYRTCFFKLF